MSEERQQPDAQDADLDLDETPEEELEPADDVGEEPVEPEAETGGEPPAERQPSRAERRIQTLNRERQELRERVARLEGQAQARPQPVQPQVDQEREAREFAERIRLMAPDEAALAVQQRVEQRTQQMMLAQEIRLGDMLDRQSFAQLQRDEPAARRWADQVERVLTQERAQGRNPTRETVYTYLAGKEVRSRSGRDTEQQRRTGARRIAAQTTRPGSARSTAATPAQRRGDEFSEQSFLERWGDTPL